MRIKGSAVSDPNSFTTNPGSPFKDVFAPSILPDGVMKLEKIDILDIQTEIDSQRDSCDMAYILKRLGIGDNSVLNVSPANYGDFRDMPTTMAEAMQLTIDAENAFIELPKDIQAQFDFNYRKWVIEAGSESWLKSMNLLNVSSPDSSSASVSKEKDE